MFMSAFRTRRVFAKAITVLTLAGGAAGCSPLVAMEPPAPALCPPAMAVTTPPPPPERRRRLAPAAALRLATRQHPTLPDNPLAVHATRAPEITAALRRNPSASYSAPPVGGRTAQPQHI